MPYEATCHLKIDGKRYGAGDKIPDGIKQPHQHYLDSGRLIYTKKTAKKPKPVAKEEKKTEETKSED